MAVVLFGLSSCISWDEPETKNYGAGPSIEVNVTADIPSDSAFTVNIVPAEGTTYYAFVIDQNDVDETAELDAYTLLKGNYGGSVVNTAENATITLSITDAEPNTTYQIYAVASNDKGIVGTIGHASITTTDGLAPVAQGLSRDAANKAVTVTLSEAVTRGDGAVTARLYKEWDILNPEDLVDDDIEVTISGNKVTFAAPDAHAGAYLCFSYEEGAFVDATGNKCPALTSGLNTTTGRFTNLYVQVPKEAFEVSDDNVTAPADGFLFGNIDDFTGELTFDFDIYRNDNAVEDGDLSVLFVGEKRTAEFKLTADDWSVEGKKLIFDLPTTPEAGDKIIVNMVEGAIADVYGNPNAEFMSSLTWTFFAPTADMIPGSYEIIYVSYYGSGSAASLGNISIELDSEVENGIIVKDFFLEGSVLKGTYDLSTGKIYIPDWQALGVYNNQYGVMFATADGTAAASFTINANGSMVADGLWGLYALDTAFENELGWLDIAKSSMFRPASTEARKAFVTVVKKAKSVRAGKSARSLNKRVK